MQRATMAPCWNGHREAHARNNGIMYTYMYMWYGLEGEGGLGLGCQWLAGLVSRVV